MHVSCMYISYTCIPCACCIFLMLDYGCSMVIIENLILILWSVFVMSTWLVVYRYMWLICWLYVTYLHPCMLGYILEYFGYMYRSCRLITRIDHLCSTTWVYVYVWLIWHCLCTLLVVCGNVYNRLMVVFMVCVLDMVTHWWLGSS